MRRCAQLLRALVMASVLVLPVVADAHPVVDEGIAAADEARFEDALAAFRRAELLSDLTADDLVALYLHRAGVQFALHNEAAGRQDLARLAALRPTFEPDPTTPPAVRQAFAQARQTTGALSLEVIAEPHTTSTRLRVVVHDDPGSVVRTLHLYVREHGTTAWTEQSPTGFDAAGRGVDYYAQAVGPGGATVAAAGTRHAPLRTSAVLAVAAAPPPERRGTPAGVWWAIGIGSVAVVATAVVVISVVATSGPSNDTAFGPPSLRSP